MCKSKSRKGEKKLNPKGGLKMEIKEKQFQILKRIIKEIEEQNKKGIVEKSEDDSDINLD